MRPNSLQSVLQRAKDVGFLGPGDVASHIHHASHFAAALPTRSNALADLGSGGGVPALPLLLEFPEVRATLVDAVQRRCSFLVWAICELGLQDRVQVVHSRVEELAHLAEHRATYNCVTARGFGPPAWTFECAIGLLNSDGRFVVSEPPTLRSWPEPELLSSWGVRQLHTGLDGVACFERCGPVPADLPRPAKRALAEPLFVLDS